MPGLRLTKSLLMKLGGIAAVALILVVVMVLGESAFREPTAPEQAAHPQVASGQPCGACKVASHNLIHEKPYQGACTDCHNLTSWTRVAYTHANEDMNLNFHELIGCARCHTEETPEPKPDCSNCHRPSIHPVLPDCAKCHTAWAWGLQRDLPAGHVSMTNGHAALTCFRCHIGATAFSAPRSCVSCHGVKHGGLTDCASCHDPSLHWKAKPTFDHNRFFVLSGRHKAVSCEGCHPLNAFASARPQCVSCHGTRHGGLRDCYRCHTTSGFVPSSFSHSSVWRLTGAHARVRCSRCHPGGAFANPIGNPDSCSSCHGSRHGGLTRCARCHTTAAFKPSTFRHRSVWALTGRHASLACRKCHPSNRYADVIGSPTRCRNCHGTRHGGQTRCEKCHTTRGFSPAKRIAHPGFPAFSGEHARRACALCHPTLVFTAPTRPCRNCHNAPHVAPTGCLRCHRPTVWSEVHFTHSDIGYHTGLPIASACIYCHTTGNYSSYRCDACHLPY